MRCPDCNKFTSKDTDTDPEGELEISNDGQVTGDIRIVNTCAECSTELEETTFTVELDFSDKVAEHVKKFHPKAKSIELSVESDLSRGDEYADKDRNGKAIKNARYRKHYYSIVASATVICDECPVSSDGRVIGSADYSDRVQASAMDSLV